MAVYKSPFGVMPGGPAPAPKETVIPVAAAFSPQPLIINRRDSKSEKKEKKEKKEKEKKEKKEKKDKKEKK